MARMGRPREFKRRARFVVYVDASELVAIHAAARAERTSAAKWARRLLAAAAAKEGIPMKKKRRKEGRRHGA
jgi:hypothetical protein